MIRILGGGPAGASAAAAAALEGAAVEIVERSHLPRHKVCGEFLSPDIAPALDRIRVLDAFLAAHPFRVRRMDLHFGNRHKCSLLPEPAFGLSRYTLDHLLWTHATALGARPVESGPAQIVATGRPASMQSRSGRLFGFKAHFEGPLDDAVELFFFERAYVGVNCVERNKTNVCGLAPEDMLRSVNFEVEALLKRCGALDRRLAPLERVMKWLFVGPLEFAQHWGRRDAFYAGDALSFVDPFTGSGILCATLSGSLAGRYAARGVPVDTYVDEVRAALERPFAFSSTLRKIAATGWAERLLPLIPGRLLFRLTRPR